VGERIITTAPVVTEPVAEPSCGGSCPTTPFFSTDLGYSNPCP